jgi:cytochrome c553
MKTPAVLASLVLGAIIGGMAVEYWMTRTVSMPAAQGTPAADTTADTAYLKSVVPTQSHTMIDVGYHWSNLWFAAEKKNWPLARYYFDEARQAIRWTVVLRPTRQLAGGKTLDVKGLFTAIDMSALAAVQLAIEDEDHAQFTTAYKSALDACYSCHVAAEKPFLRPVVPSTAASAMIGFEPPGR